jgi:DNA-binding transcriptional LysR family regulator
VKISINPGQQETAGNGMDTISNMRSIVAVARCGSFSAAARELSLSTAMVSKHVKRLEEHLDVRLMQRSTRGVSLTDPGQVYCDYAIAILAQIEEAENAVSVMNANPTGSLRISCPPSFGTHVLTPMLSDYIRHNPAVRVELGLQDDQPDVIGARLDLVIRLGELKDSSMVAKKIGDARFVLCAAPDFVRGLPRPIQAGDLPRLNCLIDASVQANNVWRFTDRGEPLVIPVDGNFRSPSTEAVIQAAIDGLGVAYVPCYAVRDDITRGGLAVVDTGFDAETMAVYAMYLGRRHPSAKTRAFLAYLEDWLKRAAIAR